MTWSSEHLKWLIPTGKTITTVCGKSTPIYEFKYDFTNNEVMSSWATHFRNHYCSDKELKFLKPPGMSNSDYLILLKFPSDSSGFGPSIRGGDFAEILVADFLSYLRNYYVPRTRYDRKIIGNESSKGSDVIAFKQSDSEPNNSDELLIYEVKSKLTENKPVNILQDAINDSSKDEVRIGESLNAIKQRLFDKKEHAGFSVVARFQNNIDQPYRRRFGAAAILTSTSYSEETLSQADCSNHPNKEDLELLVISGEKLMPLVHALFQRAADEV